MIGYRPQKRMLLLLDNLRLCQMPGPEEQSKTRKSTGVGLEAMQQAYTSAADKTAEPLSSEAMINATINC